MCFLKQLFLEGVQQIGDCDPYTPPVHQIAELFALLKKWIPPLIQPCTDKTVICEENFLKKVVRRGTSDTLSPLYKYLQGSSSIYSPNLCRSISYFAESQVCVAQHWWPPLPLLFSGCIMPVLLGGDRRRKSPCNVHPAPKFLIMVSKFPCMVCRAAAPHHITATFNGQKFKKYSAPLAVYFFGIFSFS